MPNTFIEEKMKKVAAFNGIEVFHIQTEQFKTNTINVFFQDNLSKENATKNALLPAVMRRGCERYPTFQEIALYLENLYGAIFDCGVNKKGERQIIQFYMEFVSHQYTLDEVNMFEKAFELLYEIITKPLVDKQAFKKEYVEQEKENLKKLIESRVNDKVQYATEKCFEEMCKGEPFEIYENGSISDLSAIDEKNLYQYYESAIKTLPMSIFITGQLDKKLIDKMIQVFSQIKRENMKPVGNGLIFKEVTEVKQFTEKMSVNQAKLSLGFRTNIAPDDSCYYSLLVYNGILGGGMHSKLFQNVREKESLAYYTFSRLEKFKGLMIISGGIESQNKDKAQRIILEQMEEMKKGNITDYEYDATLKTIETGIKSLRDGQMQIVDFYLSQTIAGTEDSFESIIEKTKKVSREDVIKIAQKIKLDTIYFLESAES